ncbi:MAG: DNA mismatch endonuclease Vsr [Sideroxydans sp.]|nr:DNA mismatch endonuclease Vsr [Sideroxydans sp.]
MADTLTPIERSHRMALVRSVDTKPEMVVRRLVHGMGFRYRLHCRDLPGTPDLVFRSRRAVIFVHGCFWHRHGGCALARMPKSRVQFWRSKLEGNKERDARKIAALRADKWRVLVVWECELKNREALARKLSRFLMGRVAK